MRECLPLLPSVRLSDGDVQRSGSSQVYLQVQEKGQESLSLNP